MSSYELPSKACCMTRTSEFNRWRAVVPNHFIIAVVALALPDVAFAVSTTSSGDDPLGFIIAILIIVNVMGF